MAWFFSVITQTSNDILIGNCSLRDFSKNLKTPFYLYDMTGLDALLSELKIHLRDNPKHRICYAVKANSEPEICKRMIQSGLGFDVVSGNELKHVTQLGAAPNQIYFSGVGKTEVEIDLAISQTIGGLHIESLAELELIKQRAKTLNKPTQVGVRWNPDVDVKTHPHLRTGDANDKFGLETPQVMESLSIIQDCPELTFSGLHVHIGSQILDLNVFESFYKKAKAFMGDLLTKGFKPAYLNVGGGVGIYYDNNINESPALFKKYLELITTLFKDESYTLITEPGRSLIGIYGALISRVLYIKTTPKKNFLISDASMTELLRPALYGARHPIWMIQQSQTPTDKTFEITSPICESGDTFSEDFTCSFEPTQGDLIAILGAGAYGASMASQYNLRDLPKAYFN
jgi:diaminopimelate decarboxylase